MENEIEEILVITAVDKSDLKKREAYFMKIEYSKDSEALYVQFKEDYVKKSKEIEEGVIIDFDDNGHIVGIEILDVTQRFKKEDLVNINIENLPVEIGT